ncbi:FMN-binding negative transcriptional regulator [Chromobacterium sphagni]|uniref:Transcriptional regulator n=1 Tax=Chromobacterium sphagni TaxID=1903179 RepID=A0A1S1WW00_9NEIS|nr:FMN-binding negative transcriptional regulator [Chromobacterium sphagni]OHX11494.1 transcriptional regulator [Chromobacterium sphagni]OHX17777.1 transcriptional regulator [Chromobacterium sphagni]
MYLPKHFAVDDQDALLQLMRERPLATLVLNGPDGPDANHIPLHARQTDGQLRLCGHVARANPLWRRLDGQTMALAIFHGDDAYVTPSWYPAKAEHGKVVPTWNYAVVHAHGRLRAVEDPAWLRGLLESLTREHEAEFEPPWRMADAPAYYLDRMMQAIVGIELTVARLEGKFKLSQNQDEASRGGVRRGLSASADPRAQWLAARMAERT